MSLKVKISFPTFSKSGWGVSGLNRALQMYFFLATIWSFSWGNPRCSWVSFQLSMPKKFQREAPRRDPEQKRLSCHVAAQTLFRAPLHPICKAEPSHPSAAFIPNLWLWSLPSINNHSQRLEHTSTDKFKSFTFQIGFSWDSLVYNLHYCWYHIKKKPFIKKGVNQETSKHTIISSGAFTMITIYEATGNQ